MSAYGNRRLGIDVSAYRAKHGRSPSGEFGSWTFVFTFDDGGPTEIVWPPREGWYRQTALLVLAEFAEQFPDVKPIVTLLP